MKIEELKNSNLLLSKGADNLSNMDIVTNNLETIARLEQDMDSFNLSTLLKDEFSLNEFANTMKSQ